MTDDFLAMLYAEWMYQGKEITKTALATTEESFLTFYLFVT